MYGLSRRVTPLPPGVEAVNADLFDREDVERKLGQISGITHIVFGAYVGKPTASERSAYGVLFQITSAEILARATTWAGQSEAARDEIFNITNGDSFRWKYLWPRIAAMFDMPAVDPIPTPLTVYMADKKPVWDDIVRKHGLQPLPYEQVSSWPFADAILRLMEYDDVAARSRLGAPDSTTASIPRNVFEVFCRSSPDAGDPVKKQF